nr:myeloid differentiation primary response protein MyD88 [Arenicola marina]
MQWKGKETLASVKDVSIKALSMSTRGLLSRELDIPRLTFSRAGDLQDWRGLGEKLGLLHDEIELLANQKPVGQRTVALIDKWCTEAGANIGKLILYLEEMDRFDILEDDVIQGKIVKDAQNYEGKREEEANSTYGYQPIQENEVTTSPGEALMYTGGGTDHHVDEFKNLTIREVETGLPEYFDAFVCYTHDDILFVKEMTKMLEDRHGLRLCIPERNVVPGCSHYTTISYLIEKRCKKMIVILSPDYLRSPECDFMTKFGHCLSPGARGKKMIPVLARAPCSPPAILRAVTLVDFTKTDLVEWFWDRLAASLKEPGDSARDAASFYPLGCGMNLSGSEADIARRVLKDARAGDRVEYPVLEVRAEDWDQTGPRDEGCSSMPIPGRGARHDFDLSEPGKKSSKAKTPPKKAKISKSRKKGRLF